MQKGIGYSAGGVAWNRVFTISVQAGKVSEGHPNRFGFPPHGDSRTSRCAVFHIDSYACNQNLIWH
jgi:hypothetical protein